MSTRKTGTTARRRTKAEPAAPPAAPRSLTGAQLRTELRRRLGDGERSVLWEEHGDRALLHAAQTTVELHEDGLVATVPVETDEAGVAPVVVRLALAHGDEAPSLLAVTDELAGGPPVPAARWGAAVQDAVFEALLDLLDDAAAEAGAQPVGLRIRKGRLELAVEEGTA